MKFLDRLFGKKRAANEAITGDQARSRKLMGAETGQTQAEQDATRGRMEAELDAQRQQRTSPPPPRA